jgi:hypothetical protein
MMTTSTPDWYGALAEATAAARAAAGPEVPARAADGLRLAWATEGAVRAGSPAAELWWLRLAEALAGAADDLDLVPAAPAVRLGTAPTPAALTDTADLRQAVADLLAAVADALAGHAASTESGAGRLAAVLAAGSAAWAAAVARQ